MFAVGVGFLSFLDGVFAMRCFSLREKIALFDISLMILIILPARFI